MADMREISICEISEVFDKEITHSIGNADFISAMTADSAIPITFSSQDGSFSAGEIQA